MNPDVTEPQYTARELARTLNVSLETIQRAADRAELLATRVGFRRRYPDSAAVAWLDLTVDPVDARRTG